MQMFKIPTTNSNETACITVKLRYNGLGYNGYSVNMDWSRILITVRDNTVRTDSVVSVRTFVY